MRVHSYSTCTVGVVEQKDMVNSGVGDRKKRNLRPEVYSNYNNSLSHASTTIPGNLLYWYFRRFGSSFSLPRAAADTRGQYSTLRYTGASIVRYAMRG
jgi:hypothetical protein